MYECGYMYFRFDRRHLEFRSDFGVCYHWQRPPWVHPTQNLTYNVILFSNITYNKVVYYVLILDEFHQSKLLIWRHAYWSHVMLRSWNRCCPVENLFVHKVIKHFCHISSDKKVTQQRVRWGYFHPFATQGLTLNDGQLKFRCDLRSS